MSRSERRLWSALFLVIAALGLVTVVAMVVRPEAVAETFLPPGVDPRYVWTFLPADLLAYVVFPILSARALWQGLPSTGRCLVMTGGCMLYPLAWAFGGTALDLFGGRDDFGSEAVLSTLLPALLVTFALQRWRSARPGEGAGPS